MGGGGGGGGGWVGEGGNNGIYSKLVCYKSVKLYKSLPTELRKDNIHWR